MNLQDLIDQGAQQHASNIATALRLRSECDRLNLVLQSRGRQPVPLPAPCVASPLSIAQLNRTLLAIGDALAK